MDRALRRHRHKVARAHFRRIRTNRYGWHYWVEEGFLGYRHHWQHGLMTTPGRWVTEMMTRPQRAKQNHSLILVRNGIDPDRLYWPDYRKPHLYYW